MNAYINTSSSCPVSKGVLRELFIGGCVEEIRFKEAVEIVKSDKYSYVGAYRDNKNDASVFVKCYRPKGFLNKLLTNFSMSRPFRSYDNAKEIANDFLVPEPYAILRNERSSNVYYFSKLIDGFSLVELFKEKEGNVSFRRKIIASVGLQLAKFHRLGWSHGDFKWGNVVVGGAIDCRFDSIYFVDLDSVRRCSKRTIASSRGRDLARFIVNAEDYSIAEDLVSGFVESYSSAMGETYDRCLKIAGPALKKLRKRHDVKYGLRKKTMFEYDNINVDK